jgi:hypothetical protein
LQIGQIELTLQPQTARATPHAGGWKAKTILFNNKNRQVLWQQKSDYSVMAAKATLIILLSSPIAGHHEMVDLLKG